LHDPRLVAANERRSGDHHDHTFDEPRPDGKDHAHVADPEVP
jgi:hypothetical protein